MIKSCTYISYGSSSIGLYVIFMILFISFELSEIILRLIIFALFYLFNKLSYSAYICQALS